MILRKSGDWANGAFRNTGPRLSRFSTQPVLPGVPGLHHVLMPPGQPDGLEPFNGDARLQSNLLEACPAVSPRRNFDHCNTQLAA